MTSVPLRESAVITLNGSGAGTAKLGPLSAREKWHPNNAAVSVTYTGTAPTNESQCTILVGDNTIQRQRGTTFTGSSGDSTDGVSADTIRSGEFVWAVWTGGDAGQQATLVVTGTKDV